jgi:hypothetical protein
MARSGPLLSEAQWKKIAQVLSHKTSPGNFSDVGIDQLRGTCWGSRIPQTSRDCSEHSAAGEHGRLTAEQNSYWASAAQRNPKVPARSLLGAISRSLPCSSFL